MAVYDLNIRHLAAHVAIVASGSASDAARRIHLSQPAVTQGIAKLERQLGQSLFLRRPGGMEATEAGLILSIRAEAMLRFIGTRLASSAQIRAFLALTKAGTYSAAAAATGLSEASLHRAVADLGVALGAALFERRGRSLLLTQKGHDAVRRFTLAMGELDSVMVELASLAGRETGQITIGAMPLSRSRLLPEAIMTFHAEHPNVRISVVEGSHADLVGPLREGQLAMMVGALRDGSSADLQTTPLFRDTPIVVGRAGHPLGRDGLLTGERCALYPWIVPPEGTPLRSLWYRMFSSLGVPPPRVMIECGSALTIRQLLIRSDHLTLFAPDQVALELTSGVLERLGTAPGGLERTIGITTRTDWRPTSLQARFIGTLSEAARDCGEAIIRIS